jgi:hypothetical protein
VSAEADADASGDDDEQEIPSIEARPQGMVALGADRESS